MVWKHGGVYHDLDVEAYASVSAWAPQPQCQLALLLELHERQFAQYAFAGAAQHPLLAATLAALEAKVMHGKFSAGDARHDGVLSFAGPHFFTRLVYKWLHEHLQIAQPADASTAAREAWLQQQDAPLRQHGVCVTGWERAQRLLENHMCSFDSSWCPAGDSWRQQDAGLLLRSAGV